MFDRSGSVAMKEFRSPQENAHILRFKFAPSLGWLPSAWKTSISSAPGNKDTEDSSSNKDEETSLLGLLKMASPVIVLTVLLGDSLGKGRKSQKTFINFWKWRNILRKCKYFLLRQISNEIFIVLQYVLNGFAKFGTDFWSVCIFSFFFVFSSFPNEIISRCQTSRLCNLQKWQKSHFSKSESAIYVESLHS